VSAAVYFSKNRLEAVRSLARFMGVTEIRAAGLLDNPVEYRSALRSRPVTVRAARRQLERRYAPHR
jgi:hypothetical protein